MSGPRGSSTPKWILLTLAFTVSLTGCVMNRLNPAPRTFELKRSVEGRPVTISVTKGEQWSRRMQAGPFVFNVLPQIAIWTEDDQGRLIETLYVTGAGKNSAHAAKKSKGAAFYSQCLPVWASRVKAAGNDLPSKEKPYTDAVTTATPASSFAVKTRLERAPGSFVIMAEINKSGDTNAAFTEKNNDWAGQPSVIYRAAVEGHEAGRTYALSVSGHGGMLTDAPAIYRDLSGLDTALAQVSSITATFD